LATETVRSGGRSGSGELVPAILFVPKAKEREHELLEHKRNPKQLPGKRDTDENTVATVRAPRRQFWPEMERMEVFLRLRGLWGELGGVLDSQGDGEHRGWLNLIRG
jgi:hypothetical protein